jgi:hypothetical protein
MSYSLRGTIRGARGGEERSDYLPCRVQHRVRIDFVGDGAYEVRGSIEQIHLMLMVVPLLVPLLLVSARVL